MIYLGMVPQLYTGWPVKHGCVFLVPCRKWLLQCTRVQKRTLAKSLFIRYHINTTMLIWSPCTIDLWSKTCLRVNAKKIKKGYKDNKMSSMMNKKHRLKKIKWGGGIRPEKISCCLTCMWIKHGFLALVVPPATYKQCNFYTGPMVYTMSYLGCVSAILLKICICLYDFFYGIRNNNITLISLLCIIYKYWRGMPGLGIT